MKNILNLLTGIILTGLAAQQVEYSIISGGVQNTNGTLSAVLGEEPVEGTVSWIVGQPFITPESMSGSHSVDLGFWSQRLRTPGPPKQLVASYDIYPDRIDLEWSYDPNTSPATDVHNIYRNSVRIKNNYAIENNSYTDNAADLNVGTEYSYEILGKNLFGWTATGATAIGKTSTVGSISGAISTAMNTKIPNAKLVLTPNWGKSLYLNGDSGYVSIPDGDEFEFLDNDSLPEATLEFWLRPARIFNEPLLSKGSAWEVSLIDDNGNTRLVLKRDNATIFTSDESLAVDTWAHVEIVKTSGIVSLYLNGFPATINGGSSSVTVANMPGNIDLLLIGKNNSADLFRGNIDELCFWDIARSAIDINRDYNRYLHYRTLGNINYPDLMDMFKMDGGSGTIISNSVDQQLNGTIYSLNSSTWSSAIPDVYATAYTDQDGNYQINNINYDSGTNFTLTPSKPAHIFDPGYRLAYLADATPVANEQTFTVTNLMSITGYVYFETDNTEGVQCGEPNVQIWKDGEFMGVTTDNEGFYRIEVEPGSDVHIQPYKVTRDSLDFHPPSTDFTNVIVNKTANFIDIKTRLLRGAVTGGSCEYPLGPNGFAEVILNSTSGLFSAAATVDAGGGYSFGYIPPQPYQLNVSIINPSSSELIAMDQYFANGGISINPEDSFSLNDSIWVTEADTVNFIYRSSLQASVTGFTINEFGDNQFEQNIRDTLELFAYEEYYNNCNCPVDSGTFKIIDLISDRSDTVEVHFAGDGIYRYGLLPGQPNISPPYSKPIEVIANDMLGRPGVTRLHHAVVLGHKPQQMDFTTTTPAIPFMILRRPPGDQSFAQFTDSQEMCTETEFTYTTSDGSSHEKITKAGLTVTTGYGAFVTTEISVSIHRVETIGLTSTMANSSNTSHKICFSNETGYSTGIGEDVLGYRGDLFVGGALNLLYGETKVLSINNDEPSTPYYEVTSDVIFVPDGFATTFIYTHGYIEDILIPELQFLALTDSTLHESVDRWQGMLAREDSLRWVTQDTINYSFEGGAGDFSVSNTQEVESTTTLDVSMSINTDFASLNGFAFNEDLGYDENVVTSFGINLGNSESSSETITNTSSFTLNDDDFGDDYTVGVGSDPVYGTPVFHVVAGNSSCPYETWYNEAGEVVTVPRDVPYMEWMTPGVVNNILPDNVALLTVLLRNDQDEERTYFLSFVQSSNPRGADVTINGQYDPVAYTLAGLAADSAQIAVWRGADDYYEYENLQLKFAPECEANYAGVTEGFTLSFTVNYARPCTEAEIYSPTDNWVLNISNDDTLDVVATGYDIDQSHFDQLWLQYRPLGGDTWFGINDTLIADSLRLNNQTAALLRWPVNDLLDGIYDIRLRSICLDGLITNEMLPYRGTIDRERPTALGSPEPVDGVLNMNDEIAVNLTEEINPASVMTNNVIFYDNQAEVQITDIEVSVSENRIVIDPLINNSFIENHYVEVTITGYQDMNGNPGDTLYWTFQVNRNPISWNVPSTNLIAITGETNEFTVPLNNIGSSAKQFAIIDLPYWLTAQPMQGEINPGGSFDIVFTIDPNLNVGEFDQMIYADTPEGNEPLQVNVVSMCPYPEWLINPNDYQYSMSVTAQLFIKGTQSLDEYDRLGAFIDGECRGIINVEYDEILNDYLAYLTIFSNQHNGEEIEFHIWDRTGCVEYWQVDTTLIFANDSYAGSPVNPLNLNANGAIAQEFNLRAGFTWFSFNLEGDLSADLDSLFRDLTTSEGDRLIGQDSYAQYSAIEDSWLGPLAAAGLNLGEMYYSDLDSAGSLDFVGYPIGPDTFDLYLDDGWNWIGYLPARNFNVNYALGSLNSTTEDLIKDQYSFAQYIEGSGWFGSLQWMHPSFGYKLLSATLDTLVYPTDAYLGPPLLARENDLALPAAPWTVNSHKYSRNMTITFLLESDTMGINNLADAVAAFVGDEVRGVVRPVYIPVVEEYRVFMMIYGNPGETVSFKIYESGSKITYQGNEILTFSSDEIIGTLAQPLLLTRSALQIGDFGYIPDEYSLSQNFPNPFNPITKLGFGIPEAGRVTIKIYNLLGQEVKTLIKENLDAGYRYVVWNSTNNFGQQVTSGMYIVVMESNNFREVRKMVLLK